MSCEELSFHNVPLTNPDIIGAERPRHSWMPRTSATDETLSLSVLSRLDDTVGEKGKNNIVNIEQNERKKNKRKFYPTNIPLWHG